MRVKCEYCGQFIDDTKAVCPYCNGINAQMQRTASDVPKTITALKEYCDDKDIPLKEMNFSIEEESDHPFAFGIYRDGDDFVVYKNNIEGKHYTQYRGSDEAYAVSEIFMKLREQNLEYKERILRETRNDIHRDLFDAGDNSFARDVSPTKIRTPLPISFAIAFIVLATILAIMLNTESTKEKEASNKYQTNYEEYLSNSY